MSSEFVPGTVQWFNARRGFGVIEANGKEYFVHHSNIKNETKNFSVLYAKQEVSFRPETGEKSIAKDVSGKDGEPLVFKSKKRHDGHHSAYAHVFQEDPMTVRAKLGALNEADADNPQFSNTINNYKKRTSKPSWGMFSFVLGETFQDTKYLMIMRNNSYSYEEFLRGSYDINDTTDVRSLISRLTKEEAQRIRDNDFNTLWNGLNSAYDVTVTDARKLSLAKNNFASIKANSSFYGLDMDKIKWEYPEWTFPKGKKTRKNPKESDIDCAQRKFLEETKITDYDMLPDSPICSSFKADNGVPYKETFYFSKINTEREFLVDESDTTQKAHVCAIKLMSEDECKSKIRDYHPYILEVLKRGADFVKGKYFP
jgi:CspA family cold shock protein